MIVVPEIGRFLQPDTIVPDPMDPQSLNRYSYVLNNPLRYTDPTGRCGVSTSDPGLNNLLGLCGTPSSAPYFLPAEDFGFPTWVVDHFRSECNCEPRNLTQYLGSGLEYTGVMPIFFSQGPIFNFPQRIAGLLGIAPEVSFAAEFKLNLFTYFDPNSGSTELRATARVNLHDPSSLLDVWVQAGGRIEPGHGGDAIDFPSKGYGRGAETSFVLDFERTVSGRIGVGAIQELEVGIGQLRSPNFVSFGTTHERARIELNPCRGHCGVIIW